MLPENIAPQEESPTDTMMNRSSAAIAIITPAGCRPAKAAAFFAAVWDAPAAALAVAAPPFFAAFATGVLSAVSA